MLSNGGEGESGWLVVMQTYLYHFPLSSYHDWLSLHIRRWKAAF